MPMVDRPLDSSPLVVSPTLDPPTRSGRFAPRWRDGDVLVALLVLWVASVVRVVGAGIRHEVFGTEATLALIAFVLVPCVLFRARPRAPTPAASGTRPTLRLVRNDRTRS